MNDPERGIITPSNGAAAALLLAGFDIERAFMGAKGRVQFVFAPEGRAVYEAYLRANQRVQYHISRVKYEARHGVPDDEHA